MSPHARHLYIPDARAIGRDKRIARAIGTACELAALALFVAAILAWSALAEGRL